MIFAESKSPAFTRAGWLTSLQRFIVLQISIGEGSSNYKQQITINHKRLVAI